MAASATINNDLFSLFNIQTKPRFKKLTEAQLCEAIENGHPNNSVVKEIDQLADALTTAFLPFYEAAAAKLGALPELPEVIQGRCPIETFVATLMARRLNRDRQTYYAMLTHWQTVTSAQIN